MRLFRATQYQIEAVGETVKGSRPFPIERCNESRLGTAIGNGAEHRTVPDQRVPFEIHLSNQASREGGPKNRKMHMGRAPGIGTVGKRVRPRPNGEKLVIARFIGVAAAIAAEVGVKWRPVVIARMLVPPSGIRLPYLYPCCAKGCPVLIYYAAGKQSSFAQRVAIDSCILQQVSIDQSDILWRKSWPSNFRQSG